MIKKIDFFRAATKAIIMAQPKKRRKKLKEEIAEYASIKISYINDLVLARRIGNEDTRYKIASCLGYEEYSDFLRLGEEIIEGATLETAEDIVAQLQIMRPSHDGHIEVILEKWQLMSESDKLQIRQFQRMLEFENSSQHLERKKYKEHSKERFICLWGSASRSDQQPPLTMEVLEVLSQYEAGDLSDVDILEYADTFDIY